MVPIDYVTTAEKEAEEGIGKWTVAAILAGTALLVTLTMLVYYIRK